MKTSPTFRGGDESPPRMLPANARHAAKSIINANRICHLNCHERLCLRFSKYIVSLPTSCAKSFERKYIYCIFSTIHNIVFSRACQPISESKRRNSRKNTKKNKTDSFKELQCKNLQRKECPDTQKLFGSELFLSQSPDIYMRSFGSTNQLLSMSANWQGMLGSVIGGGQSFGS